VNERQLRYALFVWRERSFIRAASRLNVAQSAVSTQVKMLEDQIGFKLFKRTGRGAEVTDNGRTFLRQAEHAVANLLGLLETAGHLRGDSVGAVAVGMGSGIAAHVMPPIICALRDELARTRLEVCTAPTARIHQLLADERYDLGLTIESDVHSLPFGLVRETIAELSMCLIARPDHPLRRRKVVNLEELSDQPIIMNELGAGYGELVLSMFSERGIRPTIGAVVDNIESVKAMVASGYGVAIVPEVATQSEARLHTLLTRSIRSAPSASVAFVTRTQPKSPSAERCVEMIRTALRARAERRRFDRAVA
jgi:DNA-binding transcriptional LysR family regulator